MLASNRFSSLFQRGLEGRAAGRSVAPRRWAIYTRETPRGSRFEISSLGVDGDRLTVIPPSPHRRGVLLRTMLTICLAAACPRGGAATTAPEHPLRLWYTHPAAK